MKNKRLCLLFAAALLMVACGGKRLPDGVLGHDQMVDFLTDAYLLEGYYAVETNYNYDSLSPEMARAYDDLLEHHGLTREQVESSFEYYAHNPIPYSKINKEVESRIEAKTTGQPSAQPVAIELAPVE